MNVLMEFVVSQHLQSFQMRIYLLNFWRAKTFERANLYHTYGSPSLILKKGMMGPSSQKSEAVKKWLMEKRFSIEQSSFRIFEYKIFRCARLRRHRCLERITSPSAVRAEFFEFFC